VQYQQRKPSIRELCYEKRGLLHVFFSEIGARIHKGSFAKDVIPQRGASSSSYLIAVVHGTSLGAYDPHRISRRHLGLGGFLPRIEGPVLEAVV
jgi:hypothetical protein